MTSHTYLDHGLTIFNTRLGVPGSAPRGSLSDPSRPFLTISRECCAGATTLGLHLVPLFDAELAQEGHSWIFLDKNLLTHALTAHRLPAHLAKFLPE